MIRVERTDTAFAAQYGEGQVIRIPIAHHDGNYFADDETLARLEGENRIAWRYCDATGDLAEAANPNGSQRHIAGIYNETGRVLGMMPHPERLAEAELGGEDGAPLFRSLCEALH